ncbi:MAG: O-antigen ligase family protein [Cellvibrionaceae bacterium]
MTESVNNAELNLSAGRRPKKDRAMTILLLYLAFEYLRIQDSILPFLAPLKIPMFLTLALLWIAIKRRKLLGFNVLVVSAGLFVLEMLAWVPFATNNFFAFQAVKAMVMIYATVLAILVIVQNRQQLYLLFKAWVVIIFFVALWVITHGGTGPGGFVADENDVCLVVVTALPFAWYLYQIEVKSKKWKLFFLGACFILLLAVVISSSRGGLVGLVAACAVMIWLSKRRWRNITIILCSGVFMGSLLLQVLPEKYVADMGTISNKDDDTRNLRFLHWTTGWEMFKKNLFFGVGPGNYPWESHRYFHLSPFYIEGKRNRAGRQSHSLYFTLIPEMGLVGVILYFTLMIKITLKLLRHKAKVEYPDEVLFCALLASLAGGLAAGAFVSVLFYPIIWHLFAFSMVSMAIVGNVDE